MIRLCTGSRLHFGLFRLPLDCPDVQEEANVSLRRFGGVGLMIENPGLQLSLERAAAWTAEGPLAERALEFAYRFAATVPGGLVRPHRIIIEQSAPEHVGLGTGTQLGLAVARGLAVACGLTDLDTRDLAWRVGRGGRSAIGIHGFAQGGLLVEAGHRAPQALAPLVARMPFPEAWRIVVVLPSRDPGLHGRLEQEAFARLAPRPAAWTDALCRLVLLGLLPALAEGDLDTFGEALHDFNSRVGEAFAPVQGGTYCKPRVAEAIRFIRQEGVRGVGQSSWGPLLFAVVGTPEAADHLVQRLRHHLRLAANEAFAVQARNQGATVMSSNAVPSRP
jgi:beta-RFAP synthase